MSTSDEAAGGDSGGGAPAGGDGSPGGDGDAGPDGEFLPGDQQLIGKDVWLVLGTMVAIYGLFVVLTALGPSEGPIIGSIASNLQAITFWAALYAMMVLALNLHWGYTGLFNIGVAGFMAVGVYTFAALSVPRSGNPPGLGVPGAFADILPSVIPFLGPDLSLYLGLVVCMVLAMAVTALVGALTALPALRLRADYLAIVTVALSEIIRLSFLSTTFQQFTLFTNLNFRVAGVELLPDVALGTGAGRGINIPINPALPVNAVFYTNPSNPAAGDPTPFGRVVFDFFRDFTLFANVGFVPALEFAVRETVVVRMAYTFVLVGVVVAFYWLLVRIGNSPFGRVLKAIREDEVVANALGKDTRLFKIKVFMVGCALMGLGGIMWEAQKGFTDPTSTTFKPLQTFYIFIALIIGGAGSNTGSVLGGALFASLLFQGPLFVARIVSEWLPIDQAPQTSHAALAGLASLDPTPLITYLLANVSSLRFVLVGLVLVVLIQRRPTGLLGHRKEVAASIDLTRRRRSGSGGSGPVATDGGEDRE